MNRRQAAREFLAEFKGDSYIFGLGVLDQLGDAARTVGRRASVVISGKGRAWAAPIRTRTEATLRGAGLEAAGDFIRGPRPNAPREDVFRISAALAEQDADVVLAVGGGSLIDGVKAALCVLALRDRHSDIEEYFGVGSVTAIMIGGTNGAHLTSFSLVDLLSHGRACALMNPYYLVLFAPAIQPQLRELTRVFRDAGHMPDDTAALSGRDLGLAVAQGMIALSQSVGFPTTLDQVPGFTPDHVARTLAAAKNPQLASKLQNMPVPLSAETVDEAMGSVLQAATTGDFTLIAE